MAPCPYAHISLCLYIPMSLCPYVPMPLCPYVPMPLYPYVSISLCAYVSMFLRHCATMSLCPVPIFVSNVVVILTFELVFGQVGKTALCLKKYHKNEWHLCLVTHKTFGECMSNQYTFLCIDMPDVTANYGTSFVFIALFWCFHISGRFKSKETDFRMSILHVYACLTCL